MKILKKTWPRLLAAGILLIVLMTHLLYTLYFKRHEQRDNLEQVKKTEYIQDGDVYSQEFLAPLGDLRTVMPYFITDDERTYGTADVELSDPDGTVLYTWQIRTENLRNKTYYRLTMDEPIPDSLGRTFVLTLRFSIEGESFLRLGTGKTKVDTYVLNGTAHTKRGLVVRQQYRHSSRGKVLQLGAVLIIVAILILLLVLPFLHKIENLFIILYLFLATAFAVTNAPFNVPDEDHHFYRAYEISEGHMLSTVYEDGTIGYDLPFKDIDFTLYEKDWSLFFADSALELTEERQTFEFWNTAAYAPITYAPQVLGIAAARLFTNNIWVIFYAGRIAAILVIGLLFYLAIRQAPFGKTIIFLIALMPMNMHEVGSYAADGCLVALICFAVSWVLYLRYEQKTPMRIRQYVLLYVLSVTIGLFKLVYLPVCLVFALIPQERFGSKKKWLIHAGLDALLAGAAAIGWYMLVKEFPSTLGVDSQQQLAYMLRNPMDFYLTLSRSLLSELRFFSTTMVGTSLGWLDVSVNGGIMLTYFALLVYHFFITEGDNHVQSRDSRVAMRKTVLTRAVSCFIFFFTTILIYVTEYLTWTAVSAQSINGFQGRYYLPMLPFLYLLVSKEYRHENNKSSHLFITVCFILLTNLTACLTLLVTCSPYPAPAVLIG